MSKGKKNKNKIKSFIKLIGVVVSILTIISLSIGIIKDLYPKLLNSNTKETTPISTSSDVKKPSKSNIKKPSISTNQINYHLSQNINVDKPIYELQNHEYIDKDNIEYYIDDFKNFNVEMINITNNNTNNDICITKFKLIIENIKVDYSPNLYLTSVESAENNISFQLFNKGWKDLNNVKIEIKDTKGFLNLEKYNITFDNFKYGTSKIFKYEFDEKDFYGSENYSLEVLVKYNEKVYETCNLSLTYYEGNLLVSSGDGRGGSSRLTYGICFPTNEDYFNLTENVQENITAGETLEMPVLFFPDRSCSFNYYIEFTVNNGEEKQIIQTEKQSLKYVVSSFADLTENDCKNETSILNNIENIGIITYPYCRKYQKK